MKGADMHNHAQFPLLYGRNQHNAAKIKKKKLQVFLGKATPILDAVGKQPKDRQFLTAVSVKPPALHPPDAEGWWAPPPGYSRPHRSSHTPTGHHSSAQSSGANRSLSPARLPLSPARGVESDALMLPGGARPTQNGPTHAAKAGGGSGVGEMQPSGMLEAVARISAGNRSSG